MRRLIFIICLLLPFTAVKAQNEDLNLQEFIFEHIADSHEWHITEGLTIPLPCIIIDNGLKVFLSDSMPENGYHIEEGKIINTTTGAKPLDFSITKNVVGLIAAAAILLILILSCAKWYKKHNVLKEKPKGLAALLEPVIMMIESDVIKACIGKNYEKFSPYLLTAFFFILINNLLGIIPIFPGGANVTGNIAVTLGLALCTFLMVNLFGSKHYYKDIVWPDVPAFLKVIPIMPIIEFVGVFTKPFSLMIRLFANILAGHIMILCVVCLIFFTAKMGAVINGSMTVVAVLFGLFMDVLELMVAFIQAYVFTMLSAVFIGIAQQSPDNHIKTQ